MKVVILGQDGMLLNLIRGSLLANMEICGVFRYERTLYSRLKMFFLDFFKSSPELTLMKKHKIKDLKLKSANSKEFKKFLLKENIDILLVGTWREKLKKEIIDMPAIASINVHPSLLPKYRGANPYLQTILHGEKFSGVTFHLINEEFDAGAILAQEKIEILDGDTSKELKNKTIFKARMLCAELLPKLENGLVIPVEQDNSQATYYPNVNPQDMTLDFEKETSTEILRRVRAFYPFLPTYLQIDDTFFVTNPYEVTILDISGETGEILQKGTRTLTIATKDGKALKFGKLRLYKLGFLTQKYIDKVIKVG